MGKRGKLSPMLRGVVGRDRLLDPVEWKLAERFDSWARRYEIPSLIGVDHEALAWLQTSSDFAHVGQIALQVKCDLELEGAVAALAAHCNVLCRAVRIEIA